MAYAKNWAEIAERAKEFIEFLEGDNFFGQPYVTDKNYMVITDAKLGMQYSCEDSCDEFPEWESVYDSQFPETFDWELSVRIGHNLYTKTKFFNFFDKNLNGILEKWTVPNVVCVSEELLCIYIKNIMNCFANQYFPPIWQEILEVLYQGGLPCGWNGHYPEGKMVVFSNF